MMKPYRQAVEQYRQRIYSFAVYSLRAAEDAEDVTQEVFIKLWQHWHKIDHDSLGAWLMRVTRNAVIDHLRRTRSSRSQIDEYSEVSELKGDADPLRDLDRDAFKRQIQAAIKDLDDPFRSILIMRDIQGHSYRDIELSLGISESQVKVYLHRGRRKLRENQTLREMFTESTATPTSNPHPVARDGRVSSRAEQD